MTFSYSNRARSFIEQAMALEPADRFRDLKTFLYSLSTMKLKLFAPDEEMNTQHTKTTPVQNAPSMVAQEPVTGVMQQPIFVTEEANELPMVAETPAPPVTLQEDEETAGTQERPIVQAEVEIPSQNNMNEQISQTFFTEPKP